MDKILDRLVNLLYGLSGRKDNINNGMDAFLKKGNNDRIIAVCLFSIPFLIISVFIYNTSNNLFWTGIPFVVMIVLLFALTLSSRLNERLQNNSSTNNSKLTGIHLDFNQIVLTKIYNYLSRYDYLDIDRTSPDDFYNLMLLDFDKHSSRIYFTMNLAELKYLLDKIKGLKKGLSLTTFEKSKRIYNKNKLITQRSLTSAYSDSRPDREFEDHIDSFYDSLTDI
ncbi:hypothetical protein B0O79_1539 [Flavobacteriaceae bacterium MAR_2009_75]|nr:hypothetical protein B0O79_1539 [Flavobacteriaceae bacterium MAR_2009_75]